MNLMKLLPTLDMSTATRVQKLPIDSTSKTTTSHSSIEVNKFTFFSMFNQLNCFLLKLYSNNFFVLPVTVGLDEKDRTQAKQMA